MNFSFKSTDEEKVMSVGDGIIFRNTSTCRQCQRESDSEKGVEIGDHCLLAGRYENLLMGYAIHKIRITKVVL